MTAKRSLYLLAFVILVAYSSFLAPVLSGTWGMIKALLELVKFTLYILFFAQVFFQVFPKKPFFDLLFATYVFQAFLQLLYFMLVSF